MGTSFSSCLSPVTPSGIVDDFKDGRTSRKKLTPWTTLKTKKWLASYECHIHRDALHSTQREVHTDWFRIHDRRWRLLLKRESDHDLSIYICLDREETKVVMHCALTIVNSDPAKSITAGALHDFGAGRCWGFPNLAPLSSLKQGGFLFGDRLTVKLDMRMKLPQNEWHSVETCQHSTKFTWKIKDVSEMRPWKLVSDEFCFGGTKWELRFHPGGDEDKMGMASAYVVSRNGYYVRAKYKIVAPNLRPINTVSHEEVYGFEARRGRGSRRFLDTRALRNSNLGFVQDGWLTLIAEISVEDLAENIQFALSSSQLLDEIQPCFRCNAAPQTSGYRHDTKIHVCLCHPCARRLKAEGLKRCTICGNRLRTGDLEFF